MYKGYFYLASPYTKFKQGYHAAYREIAITAGALASHGIATFSPVVYTHTLCQFDADKDGNHNYLNPTDHDFWMEYDSQFAQQAEGLLVCKMDGWDVSVGVQMEIDWFTKMGKPIYYFSPGEEDGLAHSIMEDKFLEQFD